MNLPLGAGSQFASLPGPGDSACRYKSTEPSALVTNVSRWLRLYRSIGFGTKKKSGSYIVSDQNPLTGGSWPFSKCMTYPCLEPSYSLPSASFSENGYSASCGKFRPGPIM